VQLAFDCTLPVQQKTGHYALKPNTEVTLATETAQLMKRTAADWLLPRALQHPSQPPYPPSLSVGVTWSGVSQLVVFVPLGMRARVGGGVCESN
jgi:hypothetical protein